MLFRPVQVNYDFSKILATDHDCHAGSCAVHQRAEMPEVYEPHGGYPDSLCLENTTIHQLWWDRDQLDWDELGQQLGIEVVSVSSIRQDPGNMIPYHRDMFHKITTKYPDRTERKVRANIFLEPAKLGHILEFTVDDQYQYFHSWQANTGFMFDTDVLHLSMNAGLQPKYTLQVSGFLLDNQSQ